MSFSEEECNIYYYSPTTNCERSAYDSIWRQITEAFKTTKIAPADLSSFLSNEFGVEDSSLANIWDLVSRHLSAEHDQSETVTIPVFYTIMRVVALIQYGCSQVTQNLLEESKHYDIPLPRFHSSAPYYPLRSCERSAYDGFWLRVNVNEKLSVNGSEMLPFLLTSGLSKDTLIRCWRMSQNGKMRNDMVREEFYVFMRCISFIQCTGMTEPTRENIVCTAHRDFPLPSFDEHFLFPTSSTATTATSSAASVGYNSTLASTLSPGNNNQQQQQQQHTTLCYPAVFYFPATICEISAYEELWRRACALCLSPQDQAQNPNYNPGTARNRITATAAISFATSSSSSSQLSSTQLQRIWLLCCPTSPPPTTTGSSSATSVLPGTMTSYVTPPLLPGTMISREQFNVFMRGIALAQQFPAEVVSADSIVASSSMDLSLPVFNGGVSGNGSGGIGGRLQSSLSSLSSPSSSSFEAAAVVGRAASGGQSLSSSVSVQPTNNITIPLSPALTSTSIQDDCFGGGGGGGGIMGGIRPSSSSSTSSIIPPPRQKLPLQPPSPALALGPTPPAGVLINNTYPSRLIPPPPPPATTTYTAAANNSSGAFTASHHVAAVGSSAGGGGVVKTVSGSCLKDVMADLVKVPVYSSSSTSYSTSNSNSSSSGNDWNHRGSFGGGGGGSWGNGAAAAVAHTVPAAVANTECVCGDTVSLAVNNTVRLRCKCLIHARCLAQYIKAQLNDASQISNRGIRCCYWHACHCYISMDDVQKFSVFMNSLPAEDDATDAVNSAVEYEHEQQQYTGGQSSSQTYSSSSFTSSSSSSLQYADVEKLQRLSVAASFDHQDLVYCPKCSVPFWVDESFDSRRRVICSNTECGVQFCRYCQVLWHVDKDCEEYQRSIGHGERMSRDLIAATSKPCPSCGTPFTHFHGHSCHHISPVGQKGGGCPSCHVHFCYACLATADENITERGDRKSCRCVRGKWSTFCESKDIKSFLVNSPYPHDSRCGCPICPDCRYQAPCGGNVRGGGASCDGTCVVCEGLVPPGPSELRIG